jgi:TolB protein
MDWSPDGTLLAFGASDGKIYTLAVASKTVAPITDGSRFDQNPVFSPDGSEILFFGDASCSTDYYAVRPDGTGLRQITAEGFCDFSTGDMGHDWSPDGNSIVTSNPGNGKVYVLPSNATSANYSTLWRPLRDGSSLNDIQPSWRP